MYKGFSPRLDYKAGVWISLLAVAGLLGGLLVCYISNTSTCCESPTAFFGGFPFSWVNGLMPYRLVAVLGSKPDMLEVVRNFDDIQWKLRPAALLVDLVFWIQAVLLVLGLWRLIPSNSFKNSPVGE
jgi:hypothetical protein